MKTITEHQNNILALCNAIRTCNEEWRIKNQDKLESILLKALPSGSGFDSDWTIELDKDSIICETSWHYMDTAGFYGGYIDLKLVINAIYRDYDGQLLYEITYPTCHKDKLPCGLHDYISDTIAYALENL